MPATYSIQVGTIIESSRKTDVFNVLQSIPNNTQKLIKPRDVRDAFLTTWSNSVFKITTPSTLSNFEYIGLDSGDPDNRDIKNKILLGKRSFGNLDIMNNNLLSSDTDIFFYNTKSDSNPQNSTKISILAGTNSSLFLNSPYIESFATASTIQLNIKNPAPGNASINLLSQNGRVSINGISFPTVSETQANIQSGKILKYSGNYPNGTLIWDDPTLTITDIGSSTSVTNIFGSPSVYLNGYSLEFIDSRTVPETLGGVTQGSSFATQSFLGQNWPLSEVIRNILYPDIEPLLNLDITNQLTGTIFAEAGKTTTFNVNYTITTFSRESSEDIRDIIIKEGSNDVLLNPLGISFIANPGSSTQSSLTYSITPNNNNETVRTFTLGTTRDNITPISSLQPLFTTSIYNKINFNVNFIQPAFSGFSNTLISGTSSLKSVTDSISKLIEPYPGTNSSYSISSGGDGYFYFIYPSSYGSGLANPSLIKDPNGYIIYDSSNQNLYGFTQSNFSHPDYSSVYKILRTNYLTSWSGTGEFEFIF
jgi:hypothetical protein